MRCKGWLIILLLICMVPVVHAEDGESPLFIYSDFDAKTELLYTTVSAFYEEVERVHIRDLEAFHLQDVKTVIVYGEQIPQTELLQNYKGELLVIGAAVKNLPQFEALQIEGRVNIQQIDQQTLQQSISVFSMKDVGNTLLYGNHVNGKVPLIVEHNKVKFLNFTEIDDIALFYISKYLPELLQIDLPNRHDTMIVLQDIHPETDAEELEEMGRYLLDRSIPLYLQVTPIYTNLNNQTLYLEDQGKLLNVLQGLVEDGAWVVAGNYRYQLSSEGVRKSDFWDVERNEPLTSNEEEEAQAIQTQLIRTVDMLTRLNLYPVALEIPNHQSSLNGYKVSTYHFSMHFGAIQQLSPFFITEPDVLYGGTLFPLTLGQYDAEEEMAFTERLNRLKEIEGAMIATGYSVFDGMAELPELVDIFTTVGDKKWVDLSGYNYEVQTENIRITNESGKLTVENELTIIDRWRFMLDEKPIEFILWVIVLITAFFVLLFTIYIVTMRVRYRKRLFEERDQW